ALSALGREPIEGALGRPIARSMADHGFVMGSRPIRLPGFKRESECHEVVGFGSKALVPERRPGGLQEQIAQKAPGLERPSHANPEARLAKLSGPGGRWIAAATC